MESTTAEVSQLVTSGMDQIVAGLRRAARSVESEGLTVAEMADLLKTAFSNRNRFDAALTGAIGALDRVVQHAPDGELTAGLSCAAWLSQNFHISSSAGYAQVRLARQLPSLPDTTRDRWHEPALHTASWPTESGLAAGAPAGRPPARPPSRASRPGLGPRHP
jgi:hypothetical protein